MNKLVTNGLDCQFVLAAPFLQNLLLCSKFLRHAAWGPLGNSLHCKQHSLSNWLAAMHAVHATCHEAAGLLLLLPMGAIRHIAYAGRVVHDHLIVRHT